MSTVMSATAAAAPLAHPRVTAIDTRHSPGPPSPSKEVRERDYSLYFARINKLLTSDRMIV